MKRVLIATLALTATVAALVVIAELTHFGERHVRAGNFDVYTTGKIPDSSVSSSLYYRRRKLTGQLDSYAVDPNYADRIVFSSSDTYHGNASVCGTFLYDGTRKLSVLLRNRPYAAGSLLTWSPDSQYVLIDQVTVRELLTDRETDLSAYVAKKDGQRPDLAPIQWSPDSRKLAAALGARTEAGNWDLDLIEVTVSPVTFRYVATIRDSSLVWTDKQIQWADGKLKVVVPPPADRQILVKPAEELAWVVAAPKVPPSRSIHEGYCSSLETKR